MTSKIKPNDGLERIELYKGGDSALGDRKDVAKLSSANQLVNQHSRIPKILFPLLHLQLNCQQKKVPLHCK